jgi:hypothetical protein
MQGGTGTESKIDSLSVHYSDDMSPNSKRHAEIK